MPWQKLWGKFISGWDSSAKGRKRRILFLYNSRSRVEVSNEQCGKLALEAEVLFSEQISPMAMHLPLLVGACWIWMYCHVFDIICLKTNFLHTGHHTSANREAGFPWLQQMKESNQPNSHKKSRFPFGALWGEQVQLLFLLCTHVCVLTTLMSVGSRRLGKSPPNWTLSRHGRA